LSRLKWVSHPSALVNSEGIYSRYRAWLAQVPEIFSIVARAIIVGVFVASGLNKAGEPEAAKYWLAALNVRRPEWVVRAAIVVELAIVAMMPFTPKWSSLVALAFLVVASMLILNGHRVGVEGCSCFGSPVKERPTTFYIARNGLLMLLTVIAMRADARVPELGAAIIALMASLYVGFVHVRRVERVGSLSGGITRW
jgi:hypothetical protein